jgi:prepilin-type N-terminal cleavage/methylation domain-containing protein
MKTQSLYPSRPVSRITHHGSRYFAFRTSHFALRAAFTLIEMLVVIAVISVLAAMIFPVTKAVNRNKIRNKARTEMSQVEGYIANYKLKLGHNPPDSTLDPRINQLFYELLGTTNAPTGGGTLFSTLDQSALITGAQLNTLFGVTGLANSREGAQSDEGRTAVKFIPTVKDGQYLIVTNGNGVAFSVLGTTLEGPFMLRSGQPPYSRINPFRYNSSNPTNNPNSFDLWVDVIVDGKTNRISNWTTQPLIVN